MKWAAGIAILPVAFFVLLALPVLSSGTQSAAGGEGCAPSGGAPLRVLPGEVTAWASWTAEQLGNAAAIITVGADKSVPPRGQQIAVMTAIQESGLVNLPGGDRDSAGLFQQRPSQGWGTRAQVRDPVYAAGQFFDRLVAVPGWEAMAPTAAAQAVQRSAYPDAYSPHWGDAGRILGHLTGGGGPTSAATEVELKVAAANVRSIAGDVAAVERDAAPDFVALSETFRVPAPRLAVAGYDAFRVEAGAGEERSTAIAWRKDRWSALDAGRELLIKDSDFTGPWPRPEDKGRSATWVTLQDTTTGTVVSVVAAHMEVNPARIGPDMPVRQRNYATAMGRLTALVDRLAATGPVLVGGDFNYQYGDSAAWGPRAQLASAGLQATFETAGSVATHDGGGTIDYVFVPAGTTVESQTTMELASDHKALIAAVTLTGATTGAAAPVYCDTPAGSGQFETNGAVAYVGAFSPDALMARAQAYAAASTSDPYFPESFRGWYRRCQHFAASLSGRASSGYGTAAAAWSLFDGQGLSHRANSVDGMAPPPGAWLYYATGHAAGHVAVYLGGGLVASTDVFGTGTAGIGPASALTSGAWHTTYLGWAVPWAGENPDVPHIPPTGGDTQ